MLGSQAINIHLRCWKKPAVGPRPLDFSNRKRQISSAPWSLRKSDDPVMILLQQASQCIQHMHIYVLYVYYIYKTIHTHIYIYAYTYACNFLSIIFFDFSTGTNVSWSSLHSLQASAQPSARATRLPSGLAWQKKRIMGYLWVPSGKPTFCYGKSSFSMGKSNYKWQFSIAMSVYQRVSRVSEWVSEYFKVG